MPAIAHSPTRDECTAFWQLDLRFFQAPPQAAPIFSTGACTAQGVLLFFL
jgi:hypothetical protein